MIIRIIMPTTPWALMLCVPDTMNSSQLFHLILFKAVRGRCCCPTICMKKLRPQQVNYFSLDFVSNRAEIQTQVCQTPSL